MTIIDVNSRLGNLATAPEESIAKTAKFLKSGSDSMTEIKLWRLYSNDLPCGYIIEACVAQANAWNTNARAFAMWQQSLGRDHLPLLLLKEEDDPANTMMWKVTYKENGVEDVHLVCAETAAEARRQFNRMARVTWVVKSIDKVTPKEKP